MIIMMKGEVEFVLFGLVEEVVDGTRTLVLLVVDLPTQGTPQSPTTPQDWNDNLPAPAPAAAAPSLLPCSLAQSTCSVFSRRPLAQSTRGCRMSRLCEVHCRSRVYPPSEKPLTG